MALKCPQSYITREIKSLIYRAHNLCTLKEDRHKEMEFLKNTFIATDCPPRLVDVIFKKYIPRRQDTNFMTWHSMKRIKIWGFLQNSSRAVVVYMHMHTGARLASLNYGQVSWIQKCDFSFEGASLCQFHIARTWNKSLTSWA